VGNAKFMEGCVRVVTLPSKSEAAEGVDLRRGPGGRVSITHGSTIGCVAVPR
jgi:hypothetical protein